ncbi:MAG TPA: 4Fe-4S binding protein [Candidatus Hydrogenedentes bacterium]|nr:4Fe-4S binding protein [Candidatus Hydrogenedentota bacterium]HRT18607.1 4Fe-4S binding protein [Candidatus Hydrogenedentota bacterium]HRT63627.1 4Fe-4S binding protein [Candidatus Hydrogenedentota bacterium]
MKDELAQPGGASVNSPLQGGNFVLIASLGLFAMAAQTLLFRDFFTVFEGNELGVGAFFGAWLVWIALGAAAGRWISGWGLPLGLPAVAYAVAFVVQQALILHARELAGVHAFAQFPFARMFAAAFVVNAPFSFLTGLLFTMASREAARRASLPAARVYIVETFGGCLGGVFTTLALAFGMPGEKVILLAAVPLLGAAAGSLRGRPRLAVGLFACALLAAAVQGALPMRWAAANARAEWSRLLTAESYRGYFTTPQGRYLYGNRGGQFIVVSNGAVCDTWPPGEHAAEVAAIHLAQKPDMRNALVIGPDALGLCDRLRAVPGIERVTWLHTDPAYPDRLRAILKMGGMPDFLPEDAPRTDLRAHAKATSSRYDAVILNLPGLSTLAMNRFASVEAFQGLRPLLNPEAMVSVCVAGGENFLGAERAFLGASLLATLQSVFKHVAMKPGEETWFFASDADILSVFPATLRKRFEDIPGAAAIYPPANIPALFPPDRIVFQQEKYDKAAREIGTDALRIEDRRPRALLFTLMLAIKQAGWAVPTGFLPLATRDGAPLLAAPLVIYLLLRLLYRRGSRHAPPADASRYGAMFLAASTGAAGMAASELLMFQYQTRHGSLYLHIGLISALFMAGAFAGGRFIEWRLERNAPKGMLLAALLAIHAAFLLLLAQDTVGAQAGFAFMFFAAGVTTGGYFPLAAALQRMGREAASVAAQLQAADNLGGASAAVLLPTLLAPMIGADAALILLGLIALNLPEFVGLRRLPGNTGRFPLRAAGYAMAGVAVYALFVSGFAALRQGASEEHLFWDAVRRLSGEEEPMREQAERPGGPAVEYARTAQGGYIFPTKPWAADIKGYAGPILLAAHVDADGRLIDYAVVKSRETRSYLSLVEVRKDRLQGRNLFDPQPFRDVAIISGATVSDRAIQLGLERAGHGFAKEILGRAQAAGAGVPKTVPWQPVRDAGILTVMLMAAYALRFSSPFRLRWAVLAVSALVLGFALNLQYSVQHVLLLLDGGVRELPWGGVFWLVVVLPAAAALFGNAYCGHVCPAGALQDLVGDLWPRRWRVAPHARVWRLVRPFKYVLLFLLVCEFALVRDYRVAQADPLAALFAGNWSASFTLFIVCMAAAGLFMPRFWCRALCPAGAFLSLFNGVRMAARWMPPRYPLHCDLGVRSVRELDCLHCDRCAANRRVGGRAKSLLARRTAGMVLFAVAAGGVLFVAANGIQSLRGPEAAAVFPASTGIKGTPRTVDMNALRRLLDRGELSRHPAEFHHPANMDE